MAVLETINAFADLLPLLNKPFRLWWEEKKRRAEIENLTGKYKVLMQYLLTKSDFPEH